ncbi:MAG: hypothetical protein AAF311_11805 [Pseudomonadota bacterium]
MAERKQFIGELSVDEELMALLSKTKDVVVTDDQLKEQRISFAFGNSPDSEFITKDTVRRSSKSVRLAS